MGWSQIRSRHAGAIPAYAPPPILIITAALVGAIVGTPYAFALTATGGVQPYTWSILSDTPDTGGWLSISPNGILSGTPTTAETESVIIKVTDTNGRSNSKLFSLGVIQPLSVSTTSPLPGATVGSAYSHSVAAAGGVPPYTWSILSDTPDTAGWLSINSAGLLTGTPTTAETETVVIQARDSTASLASKTFSLPVTGVALSITTTSPLPAGTVGIAYSQTMAASGGVAPYTWAITADTPDTGSWLSISTAGVLSGTPGTAETESLTIKVTDSMTTTVSAPFNLTIGAAAPALTYPRVMLVGDGGDQSYGCNTTNSYTPWLTAPAGNASQTFIQQVGAWDAWIGSGVYETGTTTDWTNSGARDRDNLARALLKQSTTYSVKLNKSRPTLYFPYHVMCQGTAASGGGGYQQYITQVVGMGGWLFSLAGGAGTITPASDSGNLINYSSAYLTAIGSAQPGQSIVGTNYGTTRTGSPTGAQGIARTSGNYAAIKLLMPGYTGDTSFSFTSQMGSTSCAGVFLDNAFCALDGNGPVANSSLDGVTIAPGSQQGGGYPAPDTTQVVLAHGNHNFFDQLQIMTTTYGSGNFYNFANLGQYANNYQFGTAPLTAGWSNAHGGLLEASIGDGAASWEYFQTAGVNPSGWSAVRTNYYQGMAFCVQPVWWNTATMGTFQPLVGLHTILPATDGSFNASFAVNGTLTTVTTGTALEYQLMRYGLCTALLHNGMAAFGVLENNYAVTRWYDEFGDDSLTQVNVKRGYLGAPISSPPTAANWAQGALGVWSRTWANGISIVNPRGNGSQTVVLGNTYKKLLGTQQATINNGASVTSVTLGDGDGLILLGPVSTFTPIQLFVADNFAQGAAPNVSGGGPDGQLYARYGRASTETGQQYGLVTANATSPTFNAQTTNFIRPGHTQSFQCSIKAGTSGFPADGETPAAPHGMWGCLLEPATYSTTGYGQQGDWVHGGMWMYVQSTTQLRTTSLEAGAIKFFRSSYPTTTASKDDCHICEQPAGFALLNEYDPNNTANNNYPDERAGTQLGLPRDGWHFFEFGVLLNANGDVAIRRQWMDNVLQLERNGRVIKWRTTDGVYHTTTLSIVGVPSLPSASAALQEFFIFTYWNAHPAVDTVIWMDGIITANESRTTFNAVDNLGNPIIGSGNSP